MMPQWQCHGLLGAVGALVGTLLRFLVAAGERPSSLATEPGTERLSQCHPHLQCHVEVSLNRRRMFRSKAFDFPNNCDQPNDLQ